MKKKKQKSILLVLFVLLWGILWFGTSKTVAPFVVIAHAATTYTSGDYEYQLNENDQVIITGYKGSATVLIIDQIDGKDVVSIGESAFCQCYSLREISLPETIITIEDDAFYNCYNIEKINFPSGLKNIGKDVLYGVDYIDLSEENPYYTKENGVVYDKDYTAVITSARSEIPEMIVLPETVREIYGHAFYDSLNLREIQLPDGLKEIGEWAFSGCQRLQTIQLPEGLEIIGRQAFQQSGLCECTLPESITTLGNSVLANTNVIEVIVKAQVTNLNQLCTGCTSLKKIELPQSLKILNGFNGCRALKEFVIPENIEVIEESALSSTGLTSIYIPAGVLEIQEGAFYGNDYLEEVEVAEENDRYYMQSGMLFNIDGVLLADTNVMSSEVTIPNCCRRIGNRAFYVRKGMEKLIIPDSVTEIGTFAFAFSDDLIDIEVGDQITKIEEEAFYDCEYVKCEKNYENGICYMGNYGICATCYSGNYGISLEENSEIKIKEGCVLLADRFIWDCSHVEKVIFPTSLKYIGEGAFERCGKLKTVFGGKGIERVAERAFYFCSSIKSIIFGGEKIVVESEAFASCNNLETLVIDGKQMEFQEDTFESCFGLKTLVIPNLSIPLKNIANFTPSYIEKDNQLVLLNAQGADLKENGVAYFEGCRNVNVYVNIPREELLWYENEWMEEEIFYFKDDFFCCRFLIDSHFVGWNIVLAGDGVVAPVTKEENYLLSSQGPVYCNVTWDINGDGVVDSFPDSIYDNIEAHGIYEVLEERHSWEADKELLPGNCSSNEAVSYQCQVCGIKKTVMGHFFSEDCTVDIVATCTGAGIQSYHCLRPGCEERDNITSIPIIEHSWDEGVIVKEPASSTPGEIKYTCMTCGKNRTDTVEILTSMSPSPTVEPSCEPSPLPTVEPSCEPSLSPTVEPSCEPSPSPTVEPSCEPSPSPTVEPSCEPSPLPTVEPSCEPSPSLTVEPSCEPSPSPTVEPSCESSPLPTQQLIQEPASTPVIDEDGQKNIEQKLMVDISIKKKKKVLLRWKFGENVEGYKIYRSSKKKNGFNLIKELDGSKEKYIDKKVFAGKKYYYKIKCVMGNGTKSGQEICSDIIGIYVPFYQAPIITVTKKSKGQSIKYILIRIKKYEGTRAVIQYKKGSGKFKKIVLKYDNIHRIKGRFQIRYMTGGEILSIRVRTYSIHKKKKEYSDWSKVKKVLI